MTEHRTSHYVLTFSDDLHASRIEVNINPLILQQIDNLLESTSFISHHDSNIDKLGSAPGNHEGNHTTENPFAPIAQVSFSIHEDKLLLKASLQKLGLLKEYKRCSKRTPELYPKKNVTLQQLKARLLQLKQEGLRFQILNRIVNDEIQKEYQEEEKVQEISNQDLLNEVDKKQSLKHEQIIQHISQDDALVNIRLMGEDFEETELKSTEKLLSDNSHYLKKLLSRLLPRKTSKLSARSNTYEPSTGMSSSTRSSMNTITRLNNSEDTINVKNVEFSEFSDKYRGEKLCGCFHPEIFSRFLTFCENADIQDKYYKSMETWTDFKNESQKSLDDAIQVLKDSFNSKLEFFTNYIHKERIELSSIYETCLKRDIERLKTLYRSQLDFQQSKLDALLENRRQELESFYSEEITQTQELYKNHQLLREQQLQKEKKQTEILLNHILPPKKLISIFILSDILNADELKTICMNKIADEFQMYRNSEGLSSSLLKPDTLTQLMTCLRTEELISLTEVIDYHFPTAFVFKEVEYRKSVFRNSLRSKALPLLLEMSSDPVFHNVHFPEILKEELASRRGAKPYVFILPSPYVEEDELTISHMGVNRHYITHYASHSRDYAGWSRWYFEVTLEEIHADYGTTIHIGWGVPYNDQLVPDPSLSENEFRALPNKDFSLKQKVIGLTKNHRDAAGYAISTDGMFYYNGNRETIPFTIKAGDVIGCAIDQVKKKLEFYLNGKTVVLGHTTSIEIKEQLYELYPAVSVYHTHVSKSCRLQFNFTGPFKFPIHTVVEAYGHPINARRFIRERKRLTT